MDGFDCLLVLVIIALVYFIWKKSRDAAIMAEELPKIPPTISAVKTAKTEDVRVAENLEYFSSCSEGKNAAMDVAACGDGPFQFAVSEFGAPGMDYKDFVTSQAVDPATLQNHSAYIKDRLGDNTQNVTGRTWSPDSHDSYDPIPWIGIRGRPQGVKVCNPDQVPDVDYNLYRDKPKLIWSST
jgi:hypothetical protein